MRTRTSLIELVNTTEQSSEATTFFVANQIQNSSEDSLAVTQEEVSNGTAHQEVTESIFNNSEESIGNLETLSIGLQTEEDLQNQSTILEEPVRNTSVPQSISELSQFLDTPSSQDPVADIDVDSLSNMTSSFGERTPMEMARSAPQFNEAVNQSFENQLESVQSELPVLDQPTGLVVGEAPQIELQTIPLQQVSLSSPTSERESIPGFNMPNPIEQEAIVSSPLSSPDTPQELSRAIGGLNVDARIDTNMGPRPQVDLSGEANHQQTNQALEETTETISQTHSIEINSFRRDFGENDVYPSIQTDQIESGHTFSESSLGRPILNPESDFPVIMPEDQELLNEDINLEIAEQRAQVINESQIADTTFENERVSSIEHGLQEINEQEHLAAQEQINIRTENAEQISGYRTEHQQETQDLIEDYQEELGEEQEDYDSELERELDNTLAEVETMFEEGEQEASAREIQARQEVRERSEAASREEQERSWLDEAIDAVSDFFNKLIEAVTKIIDDLRSGIQAFFQEIKERALRAIDSVRDWVIGFIRSFGAILIALSNRLLSNFPSLRDRFNGLIQDSMDWAARRVNEIAEGLKIIVTATLDFIAAAIDFALAIYQQIVVFSLRFLKELTISALKVANFFYDLIVVLIQTIGTLVIFAAIMSAGFFLSVAWQFMGRAAKERLVTVLLDLVIDLFNSAPDDFNQGWLWPLFVNMQLGYLNSIRDLEMDTKIAFFDKVAGLLFSPTFWWNFLLGIFVGIWDNIWGMIEGIWMLIRFVFYDMWIMIDSLYEKLKEIAPEIQELIEHFNDDVHEFIEQLQSEGQTTLNNIRNNLSPENINSFFENLGDDMRVRARLLGARLADQFRAYMMRDEAYAEIGMAVGRVTGYLIVELLLLFFTAGIGTAIKWGLTGIKVLVRIAKVFRNVGRAGGMLSRIIRFFGNGVKWLIRAVKKFAEKVVKLAGRALERFKTIFRNLATRIDNIVARISGRRRSLPGQRTPNARPSTRRNAPRDRTPDGPNSRNPNRNPDGPNNRPNNRPDADGQSRTRDELQWQRFKQEVKRDVRRFNTNKDGLTETRAAQILNRHIRRYRIVARRALNGVRRDKGFYELHAVKRRGYLPTQVRKQVAKVAVNRSSRKGLARIAIIRRLERIRPSQINRAGLTRILEPFIRDFHFSRLYPEWDQREVDWDIMGAMSSATKLTQVKDPNAILRRYINKLIRKKGEFTPIKGGKINGLARNEIGRQISRHTTVLDDVSRGEIRRVTIRSEENGTKYSVNVHLRTLQPNVREVLRVNRLATGLRNNPINFSFYTSRYRSFRLNVRDPDNQVEWPIGWHRLSRRAFSVYPGRTRILRIPTSLKNDPTAGSQVRGNNQVTIGINRRNKIDERDVIMRTRSSSVRNANGFTGRSYRKLFQHYNNYLSTEHIDHVHDLGYGGPDTFNNLWPLNAGKNIQLNIQMNMRQRVFYESNNERVRMIPLNGRVIGKWFFVKRKVTL